MGRTGSPRKKKEIVDTSNYYPLHYTPTQDVQAFTT